MKKYIIYPRLDVCNKGESVKIFNDAINDTIIAMSIYEDGEIGHVFTFTELGNSIRNHEFVFDLAPDKECIQYLVKYNRRILYYKHIISSVYSKTIGRIRKIH